MVLDAAVDPNVFSYPVPIIMKERGAVVRRGRTDLPSFGRGGTDLPSFGRISVRWLLVPPRLVPRY